MFRTYGFPMQLAMLRSAHATSKAPNDERLSKLRRSLDVDLSSVHPPGKDDMPIFSKLTPLSIEATLRSTSSSIARWSADYLLIVATDPADLIFLAGEARTYVPGAQLITLSSSALYGHATFSPALSGALVVSSYPLGLDGQSWQRFCSNGEGRCDLALLLTILSDPLGACPIGTIILLACQLAHHLPVSDQRDPPSPHTRVEASFPALEHDPTARHLRATAYRAPGVTVLPGV